MPNWTPDQQNAIDARSSNILVSAAAGSGKTAVLVERVIKMITKDMVPIDKLLIVTFTNAAAAEMRTRIANSLNEIIMKYPNDTNAKHQLSLLPSASICTIDSFCINLVRENFFKLNIEQDFKILDDSERLLIEQSAMDEIIGELYDENKREFLKLVEMLSTTKSDQALTNAINTISGFLNSQAFPNVWLDSACEIYNPSVELSITFIAKHIFDETIIDARFALDLINNSLDSLSLDDELFDKYSQMLNEDKLVFERLIDLANAKRWDSCLELSKSYAFSKTPFKRGYVSPSKEIVAGNKDLYKKILSKQIAPLYSASEVEYREDCEILYPISKMLVQIVKDYNSRLLDKKRELNSYTFADIEHFAIELLFYPDENGDLVRTDLAEEYKDNFTEILVDEYQDTNSAQDTLFKMLSNGRNRFMVGDIKQSIYRFRLAMPSIFNAKKEAYADYEEYGKLDSYKIILSSNFRSRKGICDYVNFVFSKFMSKQVGELDYNDEEQLNFGATTYAPTSTPCAVLNLVETPEGEDTDEYEAHQIARTILDMKNSNQLVRVKDDYRPIQFGDIAILFRSVKNRVHIFNKVFAEYGIPTISNNKVNLFENSEIVILLNLIRVIDNPAQDIPLLATLMSVFYGYDAEAIAKAKVDYPAKNLYSSIAKSREFSRLVSDLERYREYAASMSVENVIRHIIGETSYLSLISAMGNHEQRMLNVMKLVDLAKRFDSGENVGLTAFMRYVDSIISNGFNIESASVTHSGEDAITLMSIHQSKGLEFPVCILAGACHSYNYDDLKSSIQLNAKTGFGLKVHNEEWLYRYNSLQYSAIKDMNNYELMSENLRVLYVAMTRAKEQFITFYSAKDISKTVNNLSKNIVDGRISPVVVKNIKKDGDIVLMSALMHKDAQILRDMCDRQIGVDVYSDFDMQINILDYQPEERIDVVQEAEADCELLEQIKDKLSFMYNRKSISSFSSKRTASSLDDKEQDFRFLTSSKPAFLMKNNMTSAQKGTAMHAFMQYCDYEKTSQDIEAEINRLLSKSFITKEQADSLDRVRINNLFSSDFAKRLFSSEKIYREIKVSSFVPVNTLEDTDSTDDVLIQGIADLVFEENGELVLVDYKTDKADSEDELLDRYKNQVAFYKSAVSKALGKPVKEAMLYSFYLNKTCSYK